MAASLRHSRFRPRAMMLVAFSLSAVGAGFSASVLWPGFALVAAADSPCATDTSIPGVTTCTFAGGADYTWNSPVGVSSISVDAYGGQGGGSGGEGGHVSATVDVSQVTEVEVIAATSGHAGGFGGGGSGDAGDGGGASQVSLDGTLALVAGGGGGGYEGGTPGVAGGTPTSPPGAEACQPRTSGTPGTYLQGGTGAENGYGTGGGGGGGYDGGDGGSSGAFCEVFVTSPPPAHNAPGSEGAGGGGGGTDYISTDPRVSGSIQPDFNAGDGRVVISYADAAGPGAGTPEAPMALLLPVVAALPVGEWLAVTRRRTRLAR